jgi:hypothetical protein
MALLRDWVVPAELAALQQQVWQVMVVPAEPVRTAATVALAASAATAETLVRAALLVWVVRAALVRQSTAMAAQVEHLAPVALAVQVAQEIC